MTTCENDHEPIQFDSPFSALCPLCEARQKLREAEAAREMAESEKSNAQDELDMMELEHDRFRSRAKGAEETVAKMEAAISAIVYSEGEEREKAIKEAAKLID